MKKITILLALLLTLTACNSNTNLTAKNLMAGVNRNDITPIVIDNLQESSVGKATEITDFSLNIFKKILKSENTLISPLSIISALSMAANGAEKETLFQMEEVLGADIDSLNAYLYAYNSYLPTADKNKVSLANSIWFKDTESLTIMPLFMGVLNDVT